MAALTAARTDGKALVGTLSGPIQGKLNAGEVQYAGGMYMTDPDGYTRLPAALASNRGIRGVLDKNVDNSAGADGDKTGLYRKGPHSMKCTGANESWVDKMMYATSDQDVTDTNSGNLPKAGPCLRVVSATEVIVDVGNTTFPTT